MDANSFSERYNYSIPKIRTIKDSAPEEIRQALFTYIDDREISPLWVYGEVCKVIGKIPDPNIWGAKFALPELRRIVARIQWNEFYDLIEKLAQVGSFEWNGWFKQHGFQQYMNAAFANAGVAWEFDGNGCLIHFDPEGEELKLDTIEQVAAKSMNGAFQPAVEQYLRAIEYLNRRPPGFENAVKDSVGALEAVTKILSGRDTLGTAVDSLFPGIDERKPLIEIMKKLQGYRSSVPGSGHGRYKDSEVSFNEVQFVIRISGAAIAYLIGLHREGKLAKK